jgi:hypothetical protein
VNITYEFLVLSLLFLAPGVVIGLMRPDLRPLMRTTALASLPFATTEWLFYPVYWAPKFLFDLADRIGFGLEDILFNVGLGAFCSTAYAFAFRRTPVPCGAPVRPVRRAAGAIALVLAVTGLLLALGVPILYAAVAAMVSVTSGLLVMRPDLRAPSLLGAMVSAAIYLSLCLVFAAIVPSVFERTWRPSVLLPGKLFGVPLDEILYGLGAGFAGTAFPAWALGFTYHPRS